jgi:D-alanine transaminase
MRWPSRRPARSGAVEAWFVDDLGLVTEGSSSNAWIVDADGACAPATPRPTSCAASPAHTLLEVIPARGWRSTNGPSPRRGGQGAREAFITGAGTLVLPVVASTASRSAMA